MCMQPEQMRGARLCNADGAPWAPIPILCCLGLSMSSSFSAEMCNPGHYKNMSGAGSPGPPPWLGEVPVPQPPWKASSSPSWQTATWRGPIPASCIVSAPAAAPAPPQMPPPPPLVGPWLSGVEGVPYKAMPKKPLPKYKPLPQKKAACSAHDTIISDSSISDSSNSPKAAAEGSSDSPKAAAAASISANAASSSTQAGAEVASIPKASAIPSESDSYYSDSYSYYSDSYTESNSQTRRSRSRSRTRSRTVNAAANSDGPGRAANSSNAHTSMHGVALEPQYEAGEPASNGVFHWGTTPPSSPDPEPAPPGPFKDPQTP